MKRYLRKSVSFIVAASMLSSNVPMTAFAEEAAENSELTLFAEDTTQTKVLYNGSRIYKGEGTFEFVSGLNNDDANYQNGYFYEGDTVVVKIKSSEGWLLDTEKSLNYMDSKMGQSPLKLTAVDGQEDCYSFTVPNDYLAAAGLYFTLNFSPILAEGEYEVEKQDDSNQQLVYTLDKIGAKPGETVTATITDSYSVYQYGIIKVKDKDGNSIETTLESIEFDEENNKTTAVYTFVMPESSVTVSKSTSSNAAYTIKTIPEEFAEYASLSSVALGNQAGNTVTAATTIGDKFYKHNVTVNVTKGIQKDIEVSKTSSDDTSAKYRTGGIIGMEAEITVEFVETTPYTITMPEEVTGAKFTSSSTGKVSEGDTITLTLKPTTASGYYYDTEILPEVTVNGTPVEVTPGQNNNESTGTFTFTMPAGNVDISLPDGAIKQYAAHTITVDENSKKYLSVSTESAMKGGKVTITLTDPDKHVQYIKQTNEDSSFSYSTRSTKKITMPDNDVILSVIAIEDAWTDEGNYDAELYASNADTLNVSDAADFAAIAKKLKDDSTSLDGKTINITKDIDMSAHKWIPVDVNRGTVSGILTLNGNNKTISGLDIDGYCGNLGGSALFASAKNITVKDLNLSGKIRGYMSGSNYYIASIAAHTETKTTIDNCHADFDAYIDGTATVLTYGGLVYGLNSMSLKNSSVKGTFTINDATIKNVTSINCLCKESNSDIKNNYSAVRVVFGDNFSVTDDNGYYILCGIAEDINNSAYENNYFAGEFVNVPPEIKAYGISDKVTIRNSSDLIGANYSYVTPLVDESKLTDEVSNYIDTVSENNKVGKLSLLTYLNDWVSTHTLETYLTWETDPETGRPVHGAASQTAESYSIKTDITGKEYGELVVDENAEAGKKVSIYATAKTLCSLDSLKVTLADGTAVTVKTEEDGSYSFYMPGEDVTVTAVFKQDENNYTVNKTGEGEVTVKASISSIDGKASSGETITITPAPDKANHYKIGSVSVKDKDGSEIEVTEVKGDFDTSYTFTMPKADVDINVEFVSVKDMFNEDGSLKDGNYYLPIHAINIYGGDKKQLSMSDACIKDTKLKVKDGKSILTVYLQSTARSGIVDWGQNWEVMKSNNPEAERLVPEYHYDDENHIDAIIYELPSDETGSTYTWGGNYLHVYVDAMGGSVSTWFDMDFVNAVRLEDDNKLEDGVYSVPVKALMAYVDQQSMMDKALDGGNAKVTVKNGEYTVEIPFKGVEVGDVLGHLIDLWVYNGTELTADQRVAAKATSTFEDTNLEKEKAEFTKTFEFTRNAEDETVYVRVHVDAMEGFDQDARLVFDWANAKDYVEPATETTTESTTESSTESTTDEQHGSDVTTLQAPAKAEKAADDTIRFVAGIDSLKYKEVGFIFEANGKAVRRSTKTVYSSIADSKLATADFEGAEYLYSFEISDIADSGTQIRVTPYYVDLKGNEVKAESSVYSLNGLSGDDSLNTLTDESASGSAINVNTSENEKEDDNDIKEVAKEEAILNDIEIATEEEVLD
ncbi:MAG: NEAT domain-containing protein [Firmicutes bacterium]|nr:NEAT domain-containing protein [Bacillota bacterium]